MTKNKKSTQDENLKEVEQVLTKTEQFFENNWKKVSTVVAIVVAVVLVVIAANRFYFQPMQTEAAEQMFVAQQNFEKDSFDIAVNGDGIALGFLDIIDDYGRTKAGNLAKYYTGVSYLHLGEYDLAIEYLGKFKSDDQMLSPMAETAMADAFVELEEYSKALSHYKTALGYDDNDLITPIVLIKTGLLLEKMDETEKAIKYYQQIKDDFSRSSEAANAEKYIARLRQ